MPFKPEFIVVHCSATKDSGTKSWDAVKKYHVTVNGWRDIGYHLGIEWVGNDLKAFAGRSMEIPGAHCHAEGMNKKSLGVCVVGDFDKEAPSREVLLFSANEVAKLCKKFNIPVENVHGHREHEPHKTCPGTKFDMDEFRDIVSKMM